MLERERLRELLREPTPLRAAALWEKIERRRHQLPVRRRWLALAPAVAVAGALLYAWTFATSERQTPLAALRLADGQAMGPVATTHQARTVELSDGSHIELASNTRLVPRALTDRVFASELVAGKAVFDVVAHGPRAWTVSAGNVQVSVLGTRFSVERLGELTRVAVERGVVQVTGPSVQGNSRTLRAGDSLWSDPPPPAAGTAQTAKLTTPAPNVDATEAVATAASAAAASGKATNPESPARAHASVEALLHTADSARAAGQPQKAAATLERIVQRYPTDPSAGLAAFTLGQLYLETLHEPSRAAVAFRRAGELGLPQSLAEEGAVRRVEAHVKAGQRDRALAAAADYAAHFPHGLRAAAVKQFTEQR